MSTLYTFKPIYQERIWGGRQLESLYKRTIPAGKIGESWELVASPRSEQRTRRSRWRLQDVARFVDQEAHRSFLAPTRLDVPRFPILLKFDCVEKLSVQVHPPASMAEKLKGEPKTELWYFLHTEKDANIYVGLKKGVTRATPRKPSVRRSSPNCFTPCRHSRVRVMFLPGPRARHRHRQCDFRDSANSDTTYRVGMIGAGSMTRARLASCTSRNRSHRSTSTISSRRSASHTANGSLNVPISTHPPHFHFPRRIPHME